MELITDERNIKLAYRNIKNNKGSNTIGTDKITLNYYKEWETQELVKLVQNKLIDYKPKAVRRVEIPKPDGRTRPLGIPCVVDRLIQQCIKQVIEPICEAKFHEHSYGFRPNRSQEHAIKRTQDLINISKLHYAIDIDIKGFFDNINHAKLLKQIWTLGIQDKNLICIIRKILTSEVEGHGKQTKGTPQGGIISPLLSNIVLNELDWWISDQWETFETRKDYTRKRVVGRKEIIDHSHKYRALKGTNMKEMRIVRFADDFKIFCRDYKSAVRTFKAVTMWLKERLGLEISKEKSQITNVRKGKSEFLGFKLYAVKKGKKYVCNSRMSDKAFKATKQKLKDQVKLIQKHPTAENVNKFNAMILGTHNYYNKATHVVLDMGLINYEVMRTFENRLKSHLKKNQETRSKSYEKLYGGYNGRIRNVAGITTFPIYGCKTQNPKSFMQDKSNYTEEGRRLLHEKITYLDLYTQHLLKVGHHDSVELADNKIALIYGQKGMCQVTKQPLIIHEMECHHKKPKEIGGVDEYKNLVWLSKDVHKLVHATQGETINKYMNKLDLDTKQLKSINSLRKQAGNLGIQRSK